MTQTIFKIAIISFIVFLVFGLSAYVLWRIFQKRWKCTETGCEQHITGKYKSEAECNKKCKENNDTLVEDEDTEEDNDEMTAWDCTLDYECIPAKEGKFVSKQACQELCVQPQPQYTQYYYPQTLIPWYLNRRPRYWSYRRFGRPIRHDRKKRSRSPRTK